MQPEGREKSNEKEKQKGKVNQLNYTIIAKNIQPTQYVHLYTALNSQNMTNCHSLYTTCTSYRKENITPH